MPIIAHSIIKDLKNMHAKSDKITQSDKISLLNKMCAMVPIEHRNECAKACREVKDEISMLLEQNTILETSLTNIKKYYETFDPSNSRR